MINLHYGLGTLFFQYKDQNDNKLHTYGAVIRNGDHISMKELNLPEKDDLITTFNKITASNEINITNEERNDKKILEELAKNYKDKTDWKFIKISPKAEDFKGLINYALQTSIKHFAYDSVINNILKNQDLIKHFTDNKIIDVTKDLADAKDKLINYFKSHPIINYIQNNTDLSFVEISGEGNDLVSIAKNANLLNLFGARITRMLAPEDFYNLIILNKDKAKLEIAIKNQVNKFYTFGINQDDESIKNYFLSISSDNTGIAKIAKA